MLIPGAVSYTHLDVYKRQGLDRASTYRGDGIEALAFAEDVLAGFDRADGVDQDVQRCEILLLVSLGQARLREGAGRAEMEFVPVVGCRRVLPPAGCGRGRRGHHDQP